MHRHPGAGRGWTPAESSADRVDAFSEVVDLDHVDLIRRDDGILEERLHHRGAGNQETRGQLQLRLANPVTLNEPVEQLLVRQNLRAAQLDDLSQQLGLADRLDNTARRILAKNRLQLGLAVARDDEERAEVGGALEIVEDSAILGDNEREAEDGAGYAGLGQFLLAHPARREVLEFGVEAGADRTREDYPSSPRGLGRLGHAPRAVDVDLEERLRPASPDRDQADDVLGALRSLCHCRGV